MPDCAGLIPNPSWNINGKSNGAAPTAVQLAFPAINVVANVGIRSKDNRTKGLSTRRSYQRVSAPRRMVSARKIQPS